MVDAVLLPLAVMDACCAGIDELAAEHSVWDIARGAGPTVEGPRGVLTLPQITAASIGHGALALIDVLTHLQVWWVCSEKQITRIRQLQARDASGSCL